MEKNLRISQFQGTLSDVSLSASIHKSFVALYWPTWISQTSQGYDKHYQNLNEFLEYTQSLLLHLPNDSSRLNLTILRVSVETSSTAEECLVNLYKAKDLPYIQFFHQGSLLMGFELLNWTSQRDLLFLERARLFSFNSFATDFLFREKEIDVTRKIFDQIDGSEFSSPIKVFISGDRSSVGKSTICLSILAVLIHAFKIPPHQLAYIKPVTQCEAEQPVTKFCQKYNIEHVGIGPVVFYSGFTRAYLGGETDTSQEMLANVESAVIKLGTNKRFVLIDGVGYPSVGSICNISNAHVAAKLKVPVVLVGKNGVGDAVDSYNINAAYFESFGVRVLGGLFNKLDLSGFYSLELCKEAVSSYFSQFKGNQMPYGFIPKLDQILSELSISSGEDISENTEVWSKVFLQYVDVSRLFHDIWMANLTLTETRQNSTINNNSLSNIRLVSNSGMPISLPSSYLIASSTTALNDEMEISSQPKQTSQSKALKRTRDQVQGEASRKGAKGG